jgi:methyl-accepting chemotaxis protein
MQWFINLNTRTKLFLSFGLMFLFLGMGAVMGYLDITARQAAQERLFERNFTPALLLLELRAALNMQRARILEMLAASTRAEQEALERDMLSRHKDIDAGMQRLAVLLPPASRAAVQLEALRSTLEAHRQTRQVQVDLIYTGKTEEARRLAVGSQEDRFAKIWEIALELGNTAMVEAQQHIRRAAQKASRSRRLFVSIGALGLLLGVGTAVFLNRIIANPLQEMSQVAALIATGNLDVHASFHRREDEVGDLAATFTHMLQSLRDMAHVAERIAAGDLTATVTPQSGQDLLGNAFATMVSNLRQVMQEFQEAINVLATAASEILATTAQLASSTAETATAVSQTSTTVEEVKQTAQVSTQKSRSVSDSAQKVVQVAQHGHQAVEAATAGMEHIQQQMAATVESIVRLSEQSQAIGEIVATVDDLAEQSNLLSVNAAIEAAKAGEQGKGFAVVAQEVRSLAGQSKQATAQVRTILHDVQRAISAAVMATEQGSRTVEAGVQQAATTGEAIRLLADSIAESAQAAVQIVASSQQQSIGMDQVAVAMDNIKQASGQNVAGIKQAEVAVQNLHELGQRLKELVAQYQV